MVPLPDLNDKLDYLESTKNLIKTAIKNKGVSVSSSDTFRAYANKIDQINAIPLDGDITSIDVANGKYGYAQGSVVQGTVTTIPANDTSLLAPTVNIDPASIYITVSNITTDNILYRPNSVIEMDITKANFSQLAGISANKIKSGDSILGVAGSVTMESFSDYDTCNQLAYEIINE